MKLVIQRVLNASVSIDNTIYNNINTGFLVLLGVTSTDSQQDVDYLVNKLVNLRVFEDSNNKMNLSLKDVDGEVLIISQFTLYSDCSHGNRPSFVSAAKPDVAIDLYNSFVEKVSNKIDVVKTGKFGADMKVSLVNDGPVTIIIDSKSLH